MSELRDELPSAGGGAPRAASTTATTTDEKTMGTGNGDVAKSSTTTTNAAASSAATAAAAPKLNLSMSDFTVLSDLGDGSFSEVLFVERRADGHRYALKVMNKRFIMREKKAEFVKNERHAMDLCADVPGVVRLYFTFQDCNSLYLGMEPCPAGELFDQIRRRKPRGLPVRTARFYAAELLETLRGVHARGVVHRDVKPENILLDARGHVKLTDFGSCLVEEGGRGGGGGKDAAAAAAAAKVEAASGRLATGRDASSGICGEKKIDDDDELARRRRQLAFVGTCDYVPPEILGEPGGDEVGYAEDLSRPAPPPRALDFWSFGCVLYQMLTGALPFRGANEFLTYQNITEGKMTPWPEWFDDDDDEEEEDGESGEFGECESLKELKAAAKDLVRGLLERDPFRRLGSGPEGAEEVRRHRFFAGLEGWGDALRAGDAPRPLLEDPRSPSVSSVSSSSDACSSDACSSE